MSFRCLLKYLKVHLKVFQISLKIFHLFCYHRQFEVFVTIGVIPEVSLILVSYAMIFLEVDPLIKTKNAL